MNPNKTTEQINEQQKTTTDSIYITGSYRTTLEQREEIQCTYATELTAIDKQE